MTAKLTDYIRRPEGRHEMAVYGLMLLSLVIVVLTTAHGFQYYRLAPERRAFHPLNRELRPSGAIGIRMAILGVACFVGLYLYAIRKKWKRLSKIGKTRNWLDVHIVLGVSGPVLITFHSAFKMRGLAGAAYWIMIAVMLSGFVGRYLYAQIPRRINAAELTLQEMQTMTDELTESLHAQKVIAEGELEPLLRVPTKEEVEALTITAALLMMFLNDLRRPFQVARVRRHVLGGVRRAGTFWGLLPSGETSLERIIDLARQRSWIAAKIAFMEKTRQVFHLWHVVHRPFSYAFAILVCVHISVALLMGYF